MRHHIAIKFIAVFLAALALFGAVGSAVGIICFTAADLYEQSVDDLIEENLQSTRQNLAMHLVHEYASLELGNLPEEYFYNYWGTQWMYDNFNYGSYFYNIKDENGYMVKSTTEEMPTGATRYVHEVTDVSYKHLFGIISNEDESETMATTSPAENTGPTQETIVTESTFPESADSTQETIVTDSTSNETTVSATTPSEIETKRVFEEEVYSDSYYDYELDHWVDFTYYYDELPNYTVELYLMPGAVTVEPVWDLLAEVWVYRYELFYVLGISLLVFAVFAVYLCCSAGKKPGREEIRPGGFNCIPLDLYAVVGGVGIFLILLFGVEVLEYLVRYSPDVLVPFVLIAGLGICLILVGFCFACAAQFKTPGGYWYKHSMVGLCIRGLIILWNWSMEGLGNFCKSAGPVLKRFILWCLRTTKKLCVLCWLYTKQVCTAIWNWCKRICLWCGRKFARFYSLLPLTWQWLLTGFVLILVIALTVSSHDSVRQLFGWAFSLGLIIYGAHAFGILLESAKHMSKGDLETKVSSQFLVGSFEEFAGDLNALADVAVVAAQKQLKSERMKTELITNVSHDIKTPLTSIINYVDLLQKPHTDEEQEVYLEVLQRQSQQLKKLIEDLMEMSKASTGNMNVDITSVNASEAINQALGEFADKLEKAQLIPVFRQPEESIYMKADGRLAWRVMSNLLSNAVKYALPGTRLYIDLMELEGKVIISMKNISREELNVSADELLERFVRGDASRNTEGSGLGLNIAQSLMEIQKGQLQLLVDGDLFKVTLVFPAVKID